MKDHGELLTHPARGGSACDARLKLIEQLSAASNGSVPLQARMADAAQRICEAFCANACVVRSLEGHDLVLLGCAGVPRDRQKPRIAAGWGISEEVFKTLRPLSIANVSENPLTSAIQNTLPGAYLFGAYAGAPILIDGIAVGILGLYYEEPFRAGEAIDLDFLQTVTNIISAAVVKRNFEAELRAKDEALENQLDERRILEVELLHGQKLESIGRLAGDVAHSFNNMLTVMDGYTELAKAESGANHAVQSHLDNITAACMRTESLTRQMLAFARKEVIAPATVRVQRLIRETAQMLMPLLGPRIVLDIEILTQADTVFVDLGQIEHVLVNLMVNARDAMSGVGALKLRIDNRTLTAPDCTAYDGLTPGEYVCIEIADTGCGMTDAVRRRIFEPFFTTKQQGKGTGIGLATCYTAIKQNRGDIQVESAPGEGALFRILLPTATDTTAAPMLAERDALSLGGGTEGVLLVDGERAVRDLAAVCLQRFGYRVCAAASGREAFEIAVAYSGRFSIVVTDLILPDMSGTEMARRIRALYPDVRALFTSGCFDSEAYLEGSDSDEHSLLRKPFTPERLAGTVRGMLNGGV